ncbi:hypothetical protein PRK78_000500 [Emydomyces testavorans]|uniref:DASH complex subunit DUO1 n=1 Tax=Emydomyces testavorans TaxID=2070801 RepID=A0AAF0DCL5_9EURO|nr:hypothetical protein PRK78_000500 [Emydomyces testavorans]
MAAPADGMEKLQLDENSEEGPWNSNSKHRSKQGSGKTVEKPSGGPPPSAEEREMALRAELEVVRNINKVIEGAVESLERAKDNMAVTSSFGILCCTACSSVDLQNVSRTVNSASTLLDTWTRILSQTEHNQRLILNPNWQGASQDIAEMESEAIVKQQAAERRELEQQQRREALARKAAEEDRKKSEAAATTTRGLRGPSSRGRTRVAGRNPSTSNTIQNGQSAVRGAARGTTTRGTTGLRRPSSTTTRGSNVTSSRGRLRGT